jgi:general secretion pathway protein G
MVNPGSLDRLRACTVSLCVGSGGDAAVHRHACTSIQRLAVAVSGRRLQQGFTLIELMVVLTILALLLTIAVPRYFSHVERAKEATLRQDLQVMRDAIDKFYADKGRYPEQLEELVSARYIRNIPVDPMTESASTWRVIAPPDSETKGAVYDLKSGADGNAIDGSPYGDW